MTRDLQEALQTEEHPEIRFELVDASMHASVDSSTQRYRFEVLGRLTVSGTKRLIRLEVEGKTLSENRFRVRGCTPIRMTYFGIEPPTKAFGLIQVQNRVEVQFDLIAQVKGTPEAATVDSFEQAPPSSCE